MKTIKKITTNNFRGFSGERVFEFGEKLNVLDGENGFGKTTIFDAIEFCLTGKIKRYGNNFANYLKNNKNETCSVKIEFSDGKILEKNSEDISKTSELDSKNFHDILYVSQDEATNLLKQNEKKEFKESFSILLGTDEEEFFLKKKIGDNSNNSLIKNLSKAIGDLERKEQENFSKNNDKRGEISKKEKEFQEIIKNISSKNENGENILFQKVDFGKHLIWNNEENFTDIQKIEEYIKHWQILKELLPKVQEMNIFQTNLIIHNFKIKTEKNNENLKKFFPYFKGYNEDQNNYLEQKSKIEKDINQFQKFIQIFEKIQKGNLDFTQNILFENIKNTGFENKLEDINKKFLKLKKDRENLNEEKRKYNDIFASLIDFWENKFEKEKNNNLVIDRHNHTFKDDICPLCAAENREINIKEQLQFLKEKSGNLIENQNNISISELFVKEIFEEIQEKIGELEKEKSKTETVITLKNKVEENRDLFNSFQIYCEKLGINFDFINFSEKIDENKIEKLLKDFLQKLNEKIDNSISLSEDEFDELSEKYEKLFGEKFSLKENFLLNGENLIIKNSIIDKNILFLKDKIFELNNERKKYLEKEIETLKNDLNSLEKINIFLNKRKKFLERVKDFFIEYKKEGEKTIQQYKKEKIRNIALPFYIFNQRLSKNFQGTKFILTEKKIQGEINELNPTYTLSSGQSEAMALSIMLANNISYESDFDFIVIDDPIQSLDDLNILSFINLLRYQFSDKQIIISTHNQDFSDFIRYKFWRLYGDESHKSLNMKEKFLEIEKKKKN